MTEYFVKAIFFIGLPILLYIDLMQTKNPHEISAKQALKNSGYWVSISILLGGLIWFTMGAEKGAEFFTAYGIEKMLSVDNLFVFALIFDTFGVDGKLKHKVLSYGIIGAIVLRAIFIFLGAKLINATYIQDFSIFGYEIQHLNFILFAFGLFLIFAGIKTMIPSEEDENFMDSKSVKLSKRIFGKLNYTGEYDGENFFTVRNGVKCFTLLAMVVLVVELTDLLFAVDSIPAIFTVSKDTFILFSSNIMAVLGLRSLYFLLDVAKKWFEYLSYGVSAILAFIGIKMVIAPFYHIESLTSLYVVFGILLLSIGASMFNRKLVEDAPATIE